MIATALHWLGFGLCHQLPARSFFGGGVSVPVCARDTGIYIGFVASFALMALRDRGRHRSELPTVPFLVVGGLFLAAMAWDGVTSYAGWRTTSNDLRLITGLLAGWSLPLVVAPMLNSSLWTVFEPGRVMEGWKDALAWLLPLPAVFALVRWVLPLIGVAYPLLVAVCIIATFVSVNLVVAALIPAVDRKATKVRDIWLGALIALGISVVEVGAAAWLRVLLVSLTGSR